MVVLKKYDITGMSCAACSARVEKAVSSVSGVDSCSVNLLTNSMVVEGTADASLIINAVKAAGYGASVFGEEKKQKEFKNKDNSTKCRLISSVIFLALLMYVSMGVKMFGAPIPAFFEKPASNGLLQMLLSAVILVINQKFFINGAKGIINLAPNMDTLVSVGSGASFIYSTYVLFAMINAGDNAELVHHYAHDLYFESAAMILTLITLGKLLEERSKGKTTDAIKGLIDLAPKVAVVERDGVEKEIEISELKSGDVFIVRSGMAVAADGVIIEGNGSLDESSLTGESIPVEKGVGDHVSAASVNKVGFFKCRAEKVGEDTLLSQIIKIVSDTAASKAPVAKAADKVAGVFVPVVMALAVITAIVWLVFGESAGFAIARGVSVLVISCPCALGLATPVAVMVGSGVGAKNGILFKTAAALEETGRAKIAVLDKTGTITEGRPVVTDVIPFEPFSEKQLVNYSYSIEKKSEHPLAEAVVSYAEENGGEDIRVDDFKVLPGNGVTAIYKGKKIFGGSRKFICEITQLSEKMNELADDLSSRGKTPLFFCEDEKIIGIIAVADKIRDDSRFAISRLKELGMRVVMLTGDNRRTAEAIGSVAGVDEIVSDVLPRGKEEVIKNLQKDGKVIMVGDGINDAPALTAADVGIAVGGGTDIAIDSADVVLMKNSMDDVAAAVKLSRSTLRNIHQNLFWAFFYNVIGIPLAAGVWIPLFGLKLSPMFGAAAMSLSSLFVVSNALRLNFIKIYDNKTDRKKEKHMEKTLKIEGMMCGHCSGRVKKVLEELDGVKEAQVSHETGTAVVTLSADVSDDILIKTVEDQGYKVIG